MNRAQLLIEARSYLGSPYHHQGRIRGVGLDCIGMICGLARWAGVPFTDIQGYKRHGRGIDLPGEMAKWLREIDPKTARPGDVATFWIHRPTWQCHCGLLTGIGLLHTHSEVGRVVEHRMNDYWSQRVGRTFAFPTLED